jgi:type IV pilus assembly protein PilO
MENFSEMPGLKQWGILLAGAVLVTVALYFLMFKGQQDANDAAQQKLTEKVRENAELERYRPKLADMERQVANLKQQLAIEQRIVPDDKEVDNFMKMLDAVAQQAGIEIRSYVSEPVETKEFYTAVPFQLELDGPYYSVLNFFDQVSKLERIVDISGLELASTKKPQDAKVKHTYNYAPGESVVASCVATTFFSHDQVAPPTSAKGKGRKTR